MAVLVARLRGAEFALKYGTTKEMVAIVAATSITSATFRKWNGTMCRFRQTVSLLLISLKAAPMMPPTAPRTTKSGISCARVRLVLIAEGTKGDGAERVELAS